MCVPLTNVVERFTSFLPAPYGSTLMMHRVPREAKAMLGIVLCRCGRLGDMYV